MVPMASLLELGAHAVQIRSAVPASDWAASRDYVAAQAKPEDLVVFAPRWVDPIGRQTFGPEVATIARESPPDASRFPRAYEVSIRGAHAPTLEGWRRGRVQRFGAITVSAWDNPAPVRLIDDLVTRVDPEHLRVSRGDVECPFAHGLPQSGGLGFGPGVPADRFNCPGGSFVGVSVVADLDYFPHRCIYAPPPGSAPLRLRFLDLHLGRALHGHHGLYVEAERGRKGVPVTIAFKVGDSILGSLVHRDGEGWKSFELDTSEIAGKSVELDVEINAPGGDRRMYCFEADTR